MNTPVLDSHLVEETIVGRRADAKVAAVVTFGSLAEYVRRRVPEHTLAFGVFEVEQFEST